MPTEYLEKYYPLRVESYSVRTDSGGAGYHRGGHGVAKMYTFLEDGLITFQDDRAPRPIRGASTAACTARARTRR